MLPASAITVEAGHAVYTDHTESTSDHKETEKDVEHGDMQVYKVGEDGGKEVALAPGDELIALDVAVNEPLTVKSATKVLLNPVTWLPALGCLTTFGLELALDGAMAGVLFNLFNRQIKGFDQQKAGHYTSIFGFLNLVTRPFGGFLGDVVYKRYGTTGKKYNMLLCGLFMGVGFFAGGLYLQNHHAAPHKPSLPILMRVFSLAAIFSEIGNGANFALVPHCNPYNNGFMSGLVGGAGNVGGIIFAVVFRVQTAPGKAFWIIGAISIVINVLLVFIRVPK